MELEVFLQGLQDVMDTPEYAQADLQKQREVYNLYLGTAVEHAQEFQGLPGEARIQYLQTMNENFVPRFQNPELGEQVMSLYQRADSGDENAVNQIDNALASQSFRRKSLIMNVAERTLQALGSDISLVGGAGGVPEFLERSEDPDSAKALDFLRQQRQLDPEWRRAETMEQITSSIGGMAEVIGGLAMTTGLGHRSARGIGQLAVNMADSATARAVARAGSLRSQLFIRNSAAALSHGFATGAVGAAREIALEAVNYAPRNRTTREALVSGLKTFGSYVALDLVANMAFDVLMPMFKINKKIFTNWPKSNESAAKIIADLAAGNMVSPQMIKQLDEGTQEVIMQYVRSARILQNVEKATPVDLLHLSASRHGAFVRGLDDGFEVKFKNTKDLWETKTFSTIADTEDFVMNNIVRWQPEAGEAVAAGAAKGSKINIAQVVSEELPDVAAADRRVLSNIIAPRNGKFREENVRQFTRQMLKASNATDEDLAQLAVRRVGKEIEVSLPNNVRVRIPEDIGARSELPHIRRLMKGVSDATATRPVRRTTGALFHEKTYRSVLEKEGLFTPEWGLQKAKAQGYAINETPQGMRIVSPDGEAFNFSTADELNRFFISQEMTPEWVARYLKDAHGLTLASSDAGYAIRRGKKLLTGNYDSADALVREHPEFFNKLPADLSPRYIITDNNVVKAEVNTQAFHGNYREGMEFLDQFKHVKQAETTIRDVTGNKLILNRAAKGNNRYIVEVDRLRYTSPEMPLEDAKKLINEAGETFEATNRIASDKGYRLESSGGKYILYDGEGHRYVADNLQQASDILADGVPVPSYAPELIRNPDELAVQVEKIPAHMLENFHYGHVLDEMDYEGLVGQARKTWTVTKNGFGYLLGRHARPPQAHINSLVKKGADPFFARHLRDVRAAADNLAASETKIMQAIDDIVGPWKGGFLKKGKQNLARRREVWAPFLEAPDEGTRQALIKQHNISQDELRRLGQIRELWGRTPEEGLFNYFGVNPDMFIQNYLPHIRKAVMESPDLKSIPDGEWGAFMREVFGDNAPKELDAFFMHRRSIQDVVGMALERDPIALLHKYNMVGHRKLFLGPVWEQFDEGVKALNKEGLNTAAITKMNQMRADMMGIMTGPMSNALMDGLQLGLTKVGLNPGSARKWGQNLLGLPYIATMGLRPWLAVRNSIQPFITLAPRYGNKAVSSAIERVLKNHSAEYVQDLVEKGIIKRRIPIFHGLSGREHPVMEFTFRWYKNADEANRAVSYEVATGQWDEGLKALRGGDITWDQFVSRDSGIQFLYKNEQEHVLKLLNEGNYDAARLETARSLVSQSQFDYMAGSTGIMSPTLLAKAFGQMATYPVHYVQNLAKGFADTKGFAGKSLYAGTSLANGLALYYAFEKVLGINANNFLPWVPTMHSGGPWWDVINEGLESLSSWGQLEPNYSARQAQGQFLGISRNERGGVEWNMLESTIARNTIPGYYFGRSMIEGAKAINDGDYYRAFLNLGSFPLDKDYFAHGRGFNPNFSGRIEDFIPD